MTTIKRRAAIAVTLAVWIAGLGSAGALTYELKRPLSPAALPASPVAARAVPAQLSAPEPQPVLQIPTITIVGYAPRRSPSAAVREVGSAATPLRCADWRELDMGSGRVQVCE